MDPYHIGSSILFFHVVLKGRRGGTPFRPYFLLPTLGLFVFSAFFCGSYEEGTDLSGMKQVVLRRDATATVISYQGPSQKALLVNGIGMTAMTPIPKIMAHLPLLFCRYSPRSALVICFGMGTTFRSVASWGVDTTAVELVPSVRDAFSYYFKDARAILNNPKNRVIIDDGRRYLSRTQAKFDVITLDPPRLRKQPVQAFFIQRSFTPPRKAIFKKAGWYSNGLIGVTPKAFRPSFVLSCVHSPMSGPLFPCMAGGSI